MPFNPMAMIAGRNYADGSPVQDKDVAWLSTHNVVVIVDAHSFDGEFVTISLPAASKRPANAKAIDTDVLLSDLTLIRRYR